MNDCMTIIVYVKLCKRNICCLNMSLLNLLPMKLMYQIEIENQYEDVLEALFEYFGEALRGPAKERSLTSFWIYPYLKKGSHLSFFGSSNPESYINKSSLHLHLHLQSYRGSLSVFEQGIEPTQLR